MATFTRNEPVTNAVRFLQVECDVRYWEDAEVDGQEDANGTLIPMRRGDTWAPLIDIDTGKVIDWPAGVAAKIHYKVCDAGAYALLDAERNELLKIGGYVPAMLSPGGRGYGDYVIMDIDGDGLIAGWKADLSYFEDA